MATFIHSQLDRSVEGQRVTIFSLDIKFVTQYSFSAQLSVNTTETNRSHYHQWVPFLFRLQIGGSVHLFQEQNR